MRDIVVTQGMKNAERMETLKEAWEYTTQYICRKGYYYFRKYSVMTTLGIWHLAHLRSELERHDRRIPAGTQRTHYQEKI